MWKYPCGCSVKLSPGNSCAPGHLSKAESASSGNLEPGPRGETGMEKSAGAQGREGEQKKNSQRAELRVAAAALRKSGGFSDV